MIQEAEFDTLATTREHMGLDPSAARTRRHRTTRFLRFRLLPFRSPLLRECGLHQNPEGNIPLKAGLYRNFKEDLVYLFSLPPVTEMFHFTGLSTLGLAAKGRPVFNRPGFPIRTSAGQRLLATSPQLIAGCYVLHRLLMSRHPPYTLTRFSHTSVPESVMTLM